MYMEQWEGAEEGATLGLYIATDRSNNSYEVVKQWHRPLVVASSCHVRAAYTCYWSKN